MLFYRENLSDPPVEFHIIAGAEFPVAFEIFDNADAANSVTFGIDAIIW